MKLKLPRLGAGVAIIDTQTGKATKEFTRYWNEFAGNIETAVNGLADAVDAIAAAQAAAEAAQVAANAAQTAADNAQDAADAAQATADAAGSGASLGNSYVTGLTITAHDTGTDADITISDHTRVYGDGGSVSVIGATITRNNDVDFWIYYDDHARAGGTVSYQTTTTYSSAFFSQANPDRHFVGAIHTPAIGDPDTDGQPALPPGYVDP